MVYRPYQEPVPTGVLASQPMLVWTTWVKRGLQSCWTRSSTMVSKLPARPGAAKMAFGPA